MVTALIVILILGFLVIIHEFGHFLAAKKFGIWVEEFGIGIPPKVWGKKNWRNSLFLKCFANWGICKNLWRK